MIGSRSARSRVLLSAGALAAVTALTAAPVASAAPAAPAYTAQRTVLDDAGQPRAVAVHRTTGTTYVAVSSGDGTGPGVLTVVDGNPPGVRASVPLAGGASDVAVDEARNRVYVTSPGNDGAPSSITVVDASTGVVLQQVPVPPGSDFAGGARAVAVDGRDGAPYVLVGDQLRRLDPASLLPTATLRESEAGDVDIDERTGAAVLTFPGVSTSGEFSYVGFVDLSRFVDLPAEDTAIRGSLDSVAVDDTTGRAYVVRRGTVVPNFLTASFAAGGIEVFDVASRARSATITVPGDPIGVSIDATSRTGYAAERNGVVGVFDLDTNTVVGSPGVPSPAALASDAAGVQVATVGPALVRLTQAGSTTPTTTTVQPSVNASVGNLGSLITVAIANGGGGRVAFTADGAPILGCGFQPVVNGLSYCIPERPFDRAGEVVIEATYSGDDTHAASRGAAPITVAPSTDPFSYALGQALRFLQLFLVGSRLP
ncbi:hypothetical protein [Rhodococcus sp. X156]|uniref:YncE family protein n=1 Tax=Rhodococcus sp. X156 TaxID=2499145 RepID=UPI000FD838DB|nr:hypothetical protein [Rhodococcus sp. X156]